MRLSELITIYLAAAAPVGVMFFLRQPAHVRPMRTLACSSAAALLFPVTLLVLLSRRGDANADTSSVAPAAHEAKVESARRALADALHNFEDRAREGAVHGMTGAAEAARKLGSTVERYVGLALAHAEPEGEPEPRELESARVSGRTGDDLDVAGRCVRRRNAARLREHQSRARAELLHSLAQLQETVGGAKSVGDYESAWAQHLPGALLRVYEGAFDLMLALGDARGVQSLTRLLDATRARLYRQRPDAAAPSPAPREAFNASTRAVV